MRDEFKVGDMVEIIHNTLKGMRGVVIKTLHIGYDDYIIIDLKLINWHEGIRDYCAHNDTVSYHRSWLRHVSPLEKLINSVKDLEIG